MFRGWRDRWLYAQIRRLADDEDGMRRLAIISTSVGTSATTSEETLHSYQIPANTMVNDDDAIRVRSYVQTANNNNANKLVRVLFGAGANVVMSTTAQTFQNVAFIIEGWIIRTGASSQKSVFSAYQPNIEASYATAAGGGSNWSTDAEDWTAAQNILIRGQSGTVGAANDVLAYLTMVDYFPAP